MKEYTIGISMKRVMESRDVFYWIFLNRLISNKKEWDNEGLDVPTERSNYKNQFY